MSQNYNRIEPGERWCTSCLMSRPRAGGEVTLTHGGKRQRWRCGRCAEKARGRA